MTQLLWLITLILLLERLGNPQDRLPPVIHIAGTNGKGSAAAFSRALLEAEGCSVHVHTSPHLVGWHERYRLGGRDGGKFVSDAVFAEARRGPEAGEGLRAFAAKRPPRWAVE